MSRSSSSSESLATGAGWTRRANVTGAFAAAAPSEGSVGAVTGGLGAACDPPAALGVGAAAGGAAVAPSDGVVTARGGIGAAAAAPPAVTEGIAGGGGTFLASAAAMAAASADEPLLARSCSLAVAKGVASIRAARRLLSFYWLGLLSLLRRTQSGDSARFF